MAGGGGGQQQTVSEGQFPPEFRPLATSAVKQIQAAQGLLPLEQFAAPSPEQVPGIAPFQQATFNLLPNLLTPAPGLQQANQLGTPVGQAAGQLFNLGASPSGGALGALQSLANSGRVGQEVTQFPQGGVTPLVFNEGLPQAQPFPSIIPGLGAGDISQLGTSLRSPVASTPPDGSDQFARFFQQFLARQQARTNPTAPQASPVPSA